VTTAVQFLTLSKGQFQIVFNALSFVFAAMSASFIFFILMRNQISKRYQLALTLTTLVVFIAGYHYFRIFNSWNEAFAYHSVSATFIQSGIPFNEAYRYVDWILTVPLLLAELVLVLRLDSKVSRSLIIRLSAASLIMIGLGYPGELAPAHSAARLVWGGVSTLFFAYILYVLFVELSRSLGRQPQGVKALIDAMRYILLVTWLVYPAAYFAPRFISSPSTALVVRQVGYSIADVLAKPLFGLLIVAIAILKTKADAEAGADQTELLEVAA
jgi:bacteriorhodopsin